MTPDEVNILFNLIVNTQYLNQFLDQLKNEKIITGISNSFILSLSTKYGPSLRGIHRKTQQPYDWTRIESDILITDDTVKLQSYLIRGDGQSFLFNIPLRDIATFSGHFIKKTLESCTKLDKENLLSIEEKTLLGLVDNVNELKSLYDKVKKETSLIVESEEITK